MVFATNDVVLFVFDFPRFAQKCVAICTITQYKCYKQIFFNLALRVLVQYEWRQKKSHLLKSLHCASSEKDIYKNAPKKMYVYALACG